MNRRRLAVPRVVCTLWFVDAETKENKARPRFITKSGDKPPCSGYPATGICTPLCSRTIERLDGQRM